MVVLDLNKPIPGKTYSLFGNGVSTNYFYEKIRMLTDQILSDEGMTEKQMLAFLQQKSIYRRVLRGLAEDKKSESVLARINKVVHDSLREYTSGVEEHIKSVPFYKTFTDNPLFTNREQYYLYMLEFDLVNRIHIEGFQKADYRIALLPYCLREIQTNCKAIPDHVDFQCKGCLQNCYIHHVSKLLKEHDIEPYIWRNAKLKTLFKNLVKTHGRVGVMGIACIVELVAGMRRCMKAQLPVVGIPLNANRCPRWTDGFYETSVDLNALEKLVTRD